jgi:DNA-binding Lrp family transcriptional regulator
MSKFEGIDQGISRRRGRPRHTLPRRRLPSARPRRPQERNAVARPVIESAHARSSPEQGEATASHGKPHGRRANLGRSLGRRLLARGEHVDRRPALYVLANVQPGRAHAVAEEVRWLPSITDVTVVSGPYDLIIRAAGSTQERLRESVVHHLSSMEDVSRVLVCPLVGVRLPIAARVGG